MQASMLLRGAVLSVGLAALAAALPAAAQAPPPPPPPYAAPAAPLSPEAADIAQCLCLGQAVSALGAEMAAQQRAYAASRESLNQLDAELEAARARVDVNNPQSVAQFRQLLERRDAALRRSNGVVSGDLNSVIARYNARTNEYNARCANRPRDPGLLASVQATLSCPAP